MFCRLLFQQPAGRESQQRLAAVASPGPAASAVLPHCRSRPGEASTGAIRHPPSFGRRRGLDRSQQAANGPLPLALATTGKRGGRNTNGCRCPAQGPRCMQPPASPRPGASPRKGELGGDPLAALPFQLQGRAGRCRRHPPALRRCQSGRGARESRGDEALRACTRPTNHAG